MTMGAFHLKIYRAKKQWYWSLSAPNGRKIACGGEGYHNLADCEKAIARVLEGLQVTLKSEPTPKAGALTD